MEPTLTDRLTVRRMAETDLKDLLAYRNDPDVLRYLSMDALTGEQAAGFLARQAALLEAEDETGYLAFAIEYRNDGRVIGEVGIYLSPKAESKGDIGWLLRPKYQGRGYATEAAQVMLAYGFVHRHLHRITSGCGTRNTASYRLMERLGMRREGHLHQSHFSKGIWHDEYLYALLRDEWLELPNRFEAFGADNAPQGSTEVCSL